MPAPKNLAAAAKHFALRTAAGAALAAASAGAHALVIIANFDGSYNAQQQSAVNAAIAVIQPLFTDAVTVNINFNGMTTGLGSSNQFIFNIPYAQFYGALNADRTTAVDNTAVGTLSSTSDPVFGTRSIAVTHAQCGALGLIATCGAAASDGDIGINLGLVDADRSDGIASGLYDMQSVVMHEIDEILGAGGPGSGLGNTFVGVEDLFRYTFGGIRTFTTAGDDAYFSYDGGATRVARFNQSSGGDYADFWSTGPHTPQVQDAFGTSGVQVDHGPAERTILDVVGWDLFGAAATVPEPSSLWLLAPALLALRLSRRRAC